MTEEPIPDEFGSWARLLPSPEEKKTAVDKPAEQKVAAAKAAEEQPVIELDAPVIESTPDQTATLAFVSEETFDDDEPLFARAVEAKTSDEPVTAAEAADEIVAREQAPVEAVADTAEPKALSEPAAIEKAAVDEIADEKRPVEASADETEITVAQEPPAVEKITEHKPVEDKPTRSPAADEKIKRPFRVKLRGSLLVLVRLPNKRTIQGSFHQLSTTGGVIHFEKPLDEKLEVELIFHLKDTTVRSKAQMLFPMWATQGWMQPFRFVSLVDDNRRVLDEGLKSFIGDLSKSTSAGA